MRMKHEDDDGVNEDSNLSHSVRASIKEDSQRTTTLHRQQLRSHVPQVFQVTSHTDGIRSVLHVVNSIVVAVTI